MKIYGKNAYPFVIASMMLVFVASNTHAATMGPLFASDYTLTNLGSISGVTTNYGGLTFLAGTTDKLLIGGSANGPGGTLYQVDVVRGIGGHITGFGTATVFGPGPYNDGGLVYGPGGVLFAAQWPVNKLSQYKPGSTSPDKETDLAPFGVDPSLSALNFVPSGFSGAGQLKLVTYIGGSFYTASLLPDGNGTFDITGVTLETTLPGGPEGFVYIGAGSPGFAVPSMIVSEYAAGNVGAYDIDGNGNPIVSSRRTFVSGLSGAEGALIDPVTGDFLFSTFGSGNEVFRVNGFLPPTPPSRAVPEPATWFAFLGLGVCGALAQRRARAKRGV